MIHDITGTIQPGKHTVLQRNARRELYVQTFDAYGHQRELEISRDRNGVYHVAAYRHPFRPGVETVVSTDVARRLLERIWSLSQEYPLLLWNDTNDRFAQHSGFVRFHDLLLYGAIPSVKLLP